jgi:betaine-aldehyde dehydrogenase
MAASSQDIKNISLELGGKSPLVVFDDADLEQAVEWVMFGFFWNQGQVCSATSRLLVQDGFAAKLLLRLKEEAEKITTGDGLQEGTLLGRLVSKGRYDKVLAAIEGAKTENVELLTGGGRPEGFNRGYFVAPAIFVDVPEDGLVDGGGLRPGAVRVPIRRRGRGAQIGERYPFRPGGRRDVEG